MDRTLALLLSLALATSLAPLGPLGPLEPASAWPTPGVNLSLERIVPEAYETNDFIALAEARAYLAELDAAAPDFIEVLEVADSVGWDNPVTGGHDTWPAFAVEVTNEASAVPRDEKKAVVFQLSIHGNEKGGREGGLRAIEDLAIPRGWGADYRDLLDEVIVVFTFPNVDGWMHEELPYRANCANYLPAPEPAPLPELPVVGDCVETQWYVRYNGHLQDMNRDWPTTGWYRTSGGREHALSEPEIHGMAHYLLQFAGRTLSASDIHGMLAPADGGLETGLPLPFPASIVQAGGNGEPGFCPPEFVPVLECMVREGHFVLGMARGYQADAAQTLADVRIAEGSKAALQAMAEEDFPYWTALPNMGVIGGDFIEYGTVWDTLGYSDSGFTGLWFAQALGAAGVDYELSYNHMTFDNHYLPELNAIHVEATRTIVRTYLDEARDRVMPHIALPDGATVGYLVGAAPVLTVPTEAQEGPHLEAAADDAFEVVREATPTRFWADLARYADPGTFVPVTLDEVRSGAFHAHEWLAVTDDAWDLVAEDEAALGHLRMHLAQGKRILLTDSALRGLEVLGLADAASVEMGTAYMGYVDLDLDHPMATGIRFLARETFEGIPLGYGIPDASPIWTVGVDSVEGLDLAGTSLGAGRASVGWVPAGEGGVLFLGALLPTPSNEDYHPYGLADYAVTPTGYQLVYNGLGAVVTEVPAVGGRQDVAPASGDEGGPGGLFTPAPGAALAALALIGAGAMLAAARRSRRLR